METKARETIQKGATEAIALQIGLRYYARSTKHKVVIAWSLAGAYLFVEQNEPKIREAEEMLLKRGYKTRRRLVRIID